MNAEVISIGDELTSGQRLDTNSQWLSQQLCDLGVRTLYHTTVADDLAANVAVFRTAIDRADFVIATGGLGPTADDLTRQALAETIGVDLVLDEGQLEHIRALFERRRRTMPPQNQLQAMFPVGSHPISNPEGTAPGIELEVTRTGRSACRIYALPGVPAEMKAMWNASVAPAIQRSLPEARVIRHRRIKCYGVGESHLESMLPDLIARGRTPLVGITVSGATITLRITAECATEKECFASMESTIATIRSSLGEIVFGEEDDELEHVVIRLLADRELSIATAESGTAGLIAHWLFEAQQAKILARNVFLGGVVLPIALGVAEETGPDRAIGMARLARRQSQSDIGLAVSRLTSPEELGLAPRRVHVALSSDRGETRESFPLIPHKDLYEIKAAKDSLDLLRRWITRV